MKIEKVTVADAAEVLAIYAPYVLHTAITFEHDVPSLEEFQHRIKTISAKYPYIKAVQEDGTILGYAYANTFRPRKSYEHCVEVSIYVHCEHRRQQIGRLLYTTLEEILRDMGIRNMNACVTSSPVPDECLPPSSMLFHEKMGFSLVGMFHQCGYKFEKWYNMLWMEKLIGDHTLPAPEVRLGEWELPSERVSAHE